MSSINFTTQIIKKNLLLFQISKPNEAVIELASTSLETALLSCDKITYIKSAFESIVKHVNDLLNVPKCGHGTNSNLLDDTDRIRDVSPTRLMEQVFCNYLSWITHPTRQLGALSKKIFFKNMPFFYLVQTYYQ